MGRKRRYTFTIEPDVLDRMTSIADRTGVSKSEQIRRGIRWWLESHEWPLVDAHADALGAGGPSSARRKRRQEI